MQVPTTVVGSYPQPDWLIDKAQLTAAGVPRIRARQVWRVAEPWLAAAQADAVRLAVADMERAGIDIITDGEQRRESYFNQLANAFEGLDLARPGVARARTGREVPVPRIVGPIRRKGSVFRDDALFLREIATRKTKVTLPGPFTLTQLAQDDYYRDEEKLALAYAAAVNEELRELASLVDVLQLDEPYLQARPDRARTYGVAAINRALAGVGKPTVVHLCFGYAATVKEKPSGYSFLPELDRCTATAISIEAAQPKLDFGVLSTLPSKTIVLGVLDLGDPTPETPGIVARRLTAALAHVPANRLIAAPDCGMKYLKREVAFAKLQTLAEGARG
jgi:5-methyltetrahydropteroyltriglutamate--homocysteine methyltransferase